MTINRVLFAAGGVLLGLIAAEMLGASKWASRVGLAA